MVDCEDDIDGEENSSLLKGEKKDAESIGLCSNQAKVIISGVVVIVMVSAGIILGAAYSNRSTSYAKDAAKLGACSNGNIRLPENVVPIKYSIHLHPNITDGEFGFSGFVKILVQIKEPTDEIILHSKNLNILGTIVHEAKSQDLSETATFPEVPVKGHETCESLEQLVIKVKRTLSHNQEYVVHIPFNAHLATTVLEGFYKSSYTTSTGEKRYLATTHFEATGARSAFPCFDEPSMKATFTINMVRQSNHVALSNMPIMKTIDGPHDGLVVDMFEESVRMSTYLVAFVVCDFANKKKVTPKGGVEVGVWAPKEQIDQADFALDCAVKILDYYDYFFAVKFPLPKMDLIAIPDFAAGAMENWGLVTYRLTSILYDPKESSSSSKQWVATVVAHELAHQWFGDLVTMKWWNDLWLNEGFAAFVEYIGTDLVDKNWQMMDQFVIDNVQRSLVLDSHLNSHPISVTVNDPAQINEIFDTISYDKGSSIIHMMQDFLGQDVFKKGLADYLNKYKYDNAVSDDLWACMSKAVGGTLNVKKIMDTWTLQMGYPVIKVSRDPNNKKEVVATQSHFISDVVKKGDKPKPSPFNYTWDVPLTYHFGTGSEKAVTDSERKWFYHDENSVTIPLEPSAKWLKVNVDQIGFYRVNYDQDNWNALAKQLEDDHKLLSSADRANILDDAFELAKAGQISTLQALHMTTYMKKETEYVPFISGLGSIGYIGGMLLERKGYPFYEKYIIEMVRPLVETLGWKDEGSHLNKYLRGAVLGSVVAHNDTVSVQKGRDLFKKWSEGEVIPPNLRSVVYQAGIKYGGQKEWDYMFDKYKHSQYPSEKQKLMYSLAATHNKTILKSYLKMTLNPDIIKSQDTAHLISSIAGNRKGRKLALAFVKKNWDILFKRYGRGSFDMSRLIKSVFGGAKTKEGLKDAENFLKSHDVGSGRLAAKQTLAAIQNHITWLEKNEKSVTEWLKKKVTV